MSSQYAWLGDFRTGFLTYLLTSIPLWLGLSFGHDFVPFNRNCPDKSAPDFLTACSRFDGIHYASIAECGYSYEPQRRSTVAFFPAYPLAGRFVMMLTGWDARLALLVVSNLMLLGAFIVFSAYLRSRWPDADRRSRLVVLAVFGLWPAGFFFRMAYSESTFLLVMLLVLLGMVRRWPLPILAGLSGLVTAVRPVGVAVTAALLWHVLTDVQRGPISRRLYLGLLCLPLALWGLLAYMTYQGYQFNTPLAFAQTQEHWSHPRSSKRDFDGKVESLLTAEPVWGVYVPDSIRNWKRLDRHDNLFFNLFFWNPILFVGMVVLVLVGAGKSWLSGPEVVVGLGLLGIPYVTRAYEMSMASHARFAAIVVPAYLVMGRILANRAEWLTWCVVSLLSVLLMAWTALFSSGFFLF